MRAARVITETYNKPNKTQIELETMIEDGTIEQLQATLNVIPAYTWWY